MVQIKKYISMKKLAFVLVALSFAACRSEKKSTGSTDSILADSAQHADTNQQTDQAQAASAAISFKYDSLVVYSKTNKKLRDTTQASFFYPVFTDPLINDYILKKTLAGASEETKPSSYQQMAKEFVEGYEEMIPEEGSYSQSWFLEERTEVLSHKKNYLALLHTTVDYSGGAHPNSASIYWNYNPETRQEIQLKELIKPGTRPQLVAIAEKIFRKNEKLTPVASLADNYFFEHNKFDLNTNFTITKEGLKFLYNPYEIKAYAYGTTELTIPFSQLTAIARPNSLLSPDK